MSTPSLTQGDDSTSIRSSTSLEQDSQEQVTETATFGPSVYELRRRQWLTPTSTRIIRDPKQEDPGSAKLEKILGIEESNYDEDLWKKHVQGVYNGLVIGKRMRPGVKLVLAVRILKAGWMRDGTWAEATAGSAANLMNQPQSTTPGPFTQVISTSVTPLNSNRRRGTIMSIIAKDTVYINPSPATDCLESPSTSESPRRKSHFKSISLSKVVSKFGSLGKKTKRKDQQVWDEKKVDGDDDVVVTCHRAFGDGLFDLSD